MLFYLDKKQKVRKVDFREWLDLVEGSFDRQNFTDVPEWFYVCPFISQEWTGPQPGITPKGAVVSLVGLPGISGTISITNSFWSPHQICIQMPGKQLAMLNKLSKSMYENEDQMASYGLRTPRRLKAGTPRMTQDRVYRDVIFNSYSSVLEKLKSYLPTAFRGDDFVKKDGNTISIDEIMRMLKEDDPMRIDRHGRFAKRHLPEKKQRLRYQGDRKKHLGNHLKDPFNVEDLASRLRYILRDVQGIEKLDEPGGVASYRNKFLEYINTFLSYSGSKYLSEIAKALRTQFPVVYTTDKAARKYIEGMVREGKLEPTGQEQFTVVRKNGLVPVHGPLPTRMMAEEWIEQHINPEMHRQFGILPEPELKAVAIEANQTDTAVFNHLDSVGGGAHVSEIAKVLAQKFPMFNPKTAEAYIKRMMGAGKLGSIGAKWNVVRRQDGQPVHTAATEGEAQQWLTDNLGNLNARRTAKKKNPNNYDVIPDHKVKIQDRHVGEMASLLERIFREVIRSHSSYDHEQEWVMKVHPLDSDPARASYKDFSKDQDETEELGDEILKQADDPTFVSSDKLQKIQEPMDDSKKAKMGKAKWRPVLHVPEGSIVYFGTPATDRLWPWAKAEWDNFSKPVSQGGQGGDANHFYEYLVKKYKLYRLFEIHLDKTRDTTEATSQTPGRIDSTPYDQGKKDVWRILSKLISGNNQTVDGLLKLMEDRAGIPKGRMKLYFERWKALGLININKTKTGSGADAEVVTLGNPEHDEATHLILGVLKQNEMSDRDLAAQTKLPLDEVRQTLQDLETAGKVQQMGGKWDLRLSDHEMNTLNDAEKKGIKLIEEGGNFRTDFDFIDALTQENVSQADAKYALRTLKMKGKVFKSKWGEVYTLYKDSHQPMDADEDKLLEYLKDWPVSDLHSLFVDLGMSRGQIKTLLMSLEARKLVFGNDTDNDVHLNTKMVHPSANAKDITPVQHKILEAVRQHWLTSHGEVASATKVGIDANMAYQQIMKLTSKGLFEVDPTTGRYMVKGAAPIVSIEEKWLEQSLHNAHSLSKAVSAMTAQLGINYDYNTVDGILNHLSGEGKLKPGYDPINDEDVYYHPSTTYSPDTEQFEQALRELLEKRSMVKIDIDQYMKSKYNTSEKAVTYLLDLMEKHGEVEHQTDFSGQVIYHKKNYKPNGPEFYKDIILKLLETEGPMDKRDIYNKIKEESGIHKTALNWVIRWMQGVGGGDKVVEAVNHPLKGTQVIAPLNYDWSKAEEAPMQEIMKMLLAGPKTLNELENASDTIGCDYNAVPTLLDRMMKKDNAQVKKVVVLGTDTYYLDGQNPSEFWENKVYSILKSKGGEASLYDIGATMYNNYYASSSSESREFVMEMEKNGKVKRVSGDDSDPQSIIYTTEAVQQEMKAKLDALMSTYGQKVEQYMESLPDEIGTLYSLIQFLRYSHSSAFQTQMLARKFILRMEQENKIVRTTPPSVTSDSYTKFQLKQTPEKAAAFESKMQAFATKYMPEIEKQIKDNGDQRSLYSLGYDLVNSAENSNSSYHDFPDENKAQGFVKWLEKNGKIKRITDPSETDDYYIYYTIAAPSAAPTPAPATPTPAPATGTAPDPNASTPSSSSPPPITWD